MFKFICLSVFSLIGMSFCLALGQTSAGAKLKVKPLKADAIIRVEKETPQRPTFSEKAEDVSNKIPKRFVEKMLIEKTWIDNVETAGTPENLQMQGLIAAFSSGMAANSIAAQVINDDVTYKLKIQLIHYFENTDSREQGQYRLNQNRLAEIKYYITQRYLGAIFTLIQSSNVKEYEPIVAELRQLLENRKLTIVDLTPELRKSWNEEKMQVKVHQYENFGLEEKNNDQYLVNGIYIDSKKTIAIDLNRSKYENLVTIAHEIVHAADPELFKEKARLVELYGKVVTKLQPHIPREDAEVFIKALIQDTFYEMGRFDIASSMQQLREAQIQKLKINLEKQPLEKFTQDQDFKDFMRSLIAITVENEYKAYTLSYALYQNLKNDKVLPPLLTGNNFMQAQFKHQQSLPFTLSVAMNPFAKNTYMGSLNAQKSPEMVSLINQIKSIFEIHYLEQSKVMMGDVGQKYSVLFEMIKRRNEMTNEDSMPAWTRPGNFDSPTNPFQILEAKVSTAWTLRFKLNLEAFLRKIVGIQESLLSMSADMMDLHDVTFGELKLLGMQPETIEDESGRWVENKGQFLPASLNPQCRADMLNQIQSAASGDNTQVEEYLSFFSELRWKPEVSNDRTPVSQSQVMLNLYRLNLLKAVRWLRLEMPQAKDNIVGIKTMLAKLHTGQYDTNEITPERARELGNDLKTYLQAAAVSGNEFKNVEYLMTAVTQMYHMALESKWQPVAKEFYDRIMNSRRFLEDISYTAPISFAEIEKQMKEDIQKFKTQVRTEFSSCNTGDMPIDFYSRNTKMVLGRFQFPVTGICYNKRLYIFRQTCDYNRSASTTAPRGKIETKIFFGGRKIELFPFENFGR